MKLTIHDDPEALEKRIRALEKMKTMNVKVGLPATSIVATPHRAARKCVYVPGKGFNKPLFDTGALYDAFDYEIEE